MSKESPTPPRIGGGGTTLRIERPTTGQTMAAVESQPKPRMESKLPEDYDEFVFGPIMECGLPERLVNKGFEMSDGDPAKKAQWSKRRNLHAGRAAVRAFIFMTGHAKHNDIQSVRIRPEEVELHKVYEREQGSQGEPPLDVLKFAVALRLFRAGKKLLPDDVTDLNALDALGGDA